MKNILTYSALLIAITMIPSYSFAQCSTVTDNSVYIKCLDGFVEGIKNTVNSNNNYDKNKSVYDAAKNCINCAMDALESDINRFTATDGPKNR